MELEKYEVRIGFAVKGQARHCVTRGMPINVCLYIIRAKFYNVSLICADGPTEDKDVFY